MVIDEKNSAVVKKNEEKTWINSDGKVCGTKCLHCNIEILPKENQYCAHTYYKMDSRMKIRITYDILQPVCLNCYSIYGDDMIWDISQIRV